MSGSAKVALPKGTLLIILFAIAIGTILRTTLRWSSSLWEDEVIAATHAAQPFFQVILNTLFNDMHPPIYFLELHAWSLVNQSDWWLIANSVVLSLLALYSIFVVTDRLDGRQPALYVTAVYSILPVTIWMAEEVRMYSFLSVLLVWLYYYIRRFFECDSAHSLLNFKIAGLAVLICYTHAVGFFAVFCFGIYAAQLLRSREANKRAWLSWVLTFGVIVLFSFPIIISDMLHQADMPPLRHFQDVTEWMASLIAGLSYKDSPSQNILGVIIYASILLAGLINRSTRSMAFSFLILPIVTCILLGLVARPIFKTDFFSNFISVFLAIILGRCLQNARLNIPLKNLVTAALFFLLIYVAIVNRMYMNQGADYYQQIRDEIAQNLGPNDVVWAPQGDIFWGIARYMVGANWGSPIAISAPHREGSGWTKLLRFIGPTLVNEFNLAPISQHIQTQAGTYIYTSEASEKAVEQFQRIWLVTYAPRNDISPSLTSDKLGSFYRSAIYDYGPLQLSILEKATR